MGLRKSKTLALAAAGALLATLTLAGTVQADSYPYALGSWYMDSTDTNVLFDLGCTLGTQRSNGSAPQDGLVIIDYGMPKKSGTSYGTTAFGGSGGFASTTEIRNAVVEYAHGFWWCTGANHTAHVRISVGTSNFSQVGGLSATDMTKHAQAWATMVNNINADIVSHGYNSQADAYAGNDIEVSWSTFTNAKRWVDGYDGTASWGYYDYGDAAGCPTSGATGTPKPCGSWTQANVYYVGWEVGTAFAVPEIYREDAVQAKQWQQISKYATLAGKGRIYFAGSLTQHGACGTGCPGLNNTAADGWHQLHDTVNADSGTAIPTLRFATDIRWH